MDLALLQAVVSETDRRLAEQELLRVGYLGRHRYLFRFASPGRDNLLISVRRGLPRLHLTPLGIHEPEEPPDRFATLADRELASSRLAGLLVPGPDRLVLLHFRRAGEDAGAARRTLVVELFGRSADALLLDADSIVVATAHQAAPGRSASSVGRSYR